jgi:hypothetical protein
MTPKKVYKLEVMVIDHDEIGIEEAISLLENTRYPNYAISPNVMFYDVAEVEWSDENPLNKLDTQVDAFEQLFPKEQL